MRGTQQRHVHPLMRVAAAARNRLRFVPTGTRPRVREEGRGMAGAFAPPAGAARGGGGGVSSDTASEVQAGGNEGSGGGDQNWQDPTRRSLPPMPAPPLRRGPRGTPHEGVLLARTPDTLAQRVPGAPPTLWVCTDAIGLVARAHWTRGARLREGALPAPPIGA
jgi:hypothetical protein